LLRCEGLLDGAVELFTDEAEDFDDAEIGFHDLGVGDGSDLAAGVQILGEAGRAGKGVGSDAGIVLIVVLKRDGVGWSGNPIEVGDYLIRFEVGGAERERVFGESDGGNEAVGGRKEKLAVGQFVVEQTVGDGTDVTGCCADGGIDGGGIGKVAVNEGG